MPEEALAVYIDAAKSAGTIDVLSKVMRDLARYGEKFPLPKDIINAVVEERKSRHLALLSTAKCPHCDGTGMTQVKKPYGGNNPMLKQIYGENLLESSERCPRCNPITRELPEQPPAKKQFGFKKPDIKDFPRGLFEE